MIRRPRESGDILDHGPYTITKNNGESPIIIIKVTRRKV
jgi:hypothetical protein